MIWNMLHIEERLLLFSIHKMILTRIICLFLHTWTLQATWSIYYFRRSNNAANISLYSYHPTNQNGSKEIASFEYPQNIDYQVAPIWDCKVAIVPENSITQEVVTFNMLTKEVKTEHTLLTKRSKFATELVDQSRLYVCGGLQRMENACEVWLQGQKTFTGSNFTWSDKGEQGPRSKFTLHQIGKRICAFGGKKLLYQGTTRATRCFSTEGDEAIDLYMDPGCSDTTLKYRADHVSILYDSNIIILCGGEAGDPTDECGVVQMGLSAVPQTQTCLKPIQVKDWRHYSTSRLLRWGEDILLFGLLSTRVGDEDRVIKLITSFRHRGEEQLPLLHKDYSNIRMFNVRDSCIPSGYVTSQAPQTTVTLSNGNVPEQSSASCHIALGCISALCLLLFGLLVFVTVRWVIPIQVSKENTQPVKMPKSRSESCRMPSQNTDLGSSQLTSASSRRPNDLLLGINSNSKLGQAVVSSQLITFPQISKSSATYVNSMIGSSEICSHTNTRTPVASSHHSTLVELQRNQN